jgi:ribonuclease HI/pterin-4a-carbinolamine dehydratase
MWRETKHGLYKKFGFDNFSQAWEFMTKVAALAESRQHHPRWENDYNVVQIWLISHDAGNEITDKDREMASAIDELVAAPANNASASDKAASASQPKKLKIYTDGGSRGNPGPSASGFVLYDEDDNVLADKGVYLGITTNNQAEYTALKLALEEARKLGASELAIYMDSLLVVNQMNGVFKIKNRDLWPIHDAIKQLASGFNKVSFTHVPRELNKAADAAVNRALDEQLKNS